MKNVGWLLPALAAAYGCAVVAPVLRSRLRGKLADLMGWYFAPVMFACPLLIPAGHAGLRALVATVSIDSFFKMVDYFRQWDHFDRSIAFREYYRLLIPFPVFAV